MPLKKQFRLALIVPSKCDYIGLVILGYFWLASILINVISFAHLQLFSANDGKNNCKFTNKTTYIGIEVNQR